MVNFTKEDWIKQLELQPHPEGGYFKQMYTGETGTIKGKEEKKLYTSIYFLLDTQSPSHFHRLTSDEIWYFHTGSSLSVHMLTPEGTYEKVALGTSLQHGEQLQFVVPKGTIFGSTVEKGYSLVSCMVAPGFEFSDFELFTQKQLLTKYPDQEDIIRRLAYKTLL